MKSKLLVEMFYNPDVDVREVMPNDTEDIIKDKQKYPFMARKKAILKIAYLDKDGNLFTTAFSNPVNFKYDGATIPFKIGKGNMKLLIPAMWHDIMCDHKDKIDFNRYLSSLVFKELLIQCKVNKLVANFMFICVDNWQKLQRGWKLNG